MVAAYGEIHRYVGDELIATWKLSNGIADAHCVRARFDAPERLTALSPVYVRDFGTPFALPSGTALRSGGNWGNGLGQERDRLSW
jgi:hypothetical protein